MIKEDLIKTLSSLVKGEFSPSEWIVWWKRNQIEVEKNVSRNDYLKIKPSPTHSENRATLISQNSAILYLRKEGIILDQSNYYSELWNKEFNEFTEKSDQENIKAKLIFREKFKNLEHSFPRFYSTLTNHIDSDDKIILGNQKILNLAEATLQKKLPSEIQEFILNISIINLEEFKFNVENIEVIKIDTIDYIYLAQFNYFSDGDSIILKNDYSDNNIYYLYHSEKPKKIIQIAPDFKIFIEKTLSTFIKKSD